MGVGLNDLGIGIVESARPGETFSRREEFSDWKWVIFRVPAYVGIVNQSRAVSFRNPDSNARVTITGKLVDRDIEVLEQQEKIIQRIPLMVQSSARNI